MKSRSVSSCDGAWCWNAIEIGWQSYIATKGEVSALEHQGFHLGKTFFCVEVRDPISISGVLRLSGFQRPVDLGDGRNAWLVLAMLDAIEGLGPDAGSAGEFRL